MMKRFSGRGFFAFLAAIVLFVAYTIVDGPVGQSASLTNASATLTNSRISFISELDGAHTSGTSIVSVVSDTQNSTAQLVSGDTVRINVNNYTVSESTPPGEFAITTALQAGDVTSGAPVTSAQSTNVQIRFTTANAINDGSFRILVPAAPSNNNDGIPDRGFFDFGGGTGATVTCPASITGYGSWTPTAQAAQTIGSDLYHVFTCSYTGTGGVSTNFDGGSNGMITISGLVNPARDATGAIGQAESHVFAIQHLNSSNAVVDETGVAVGVIEAVKVTATVAPVINFSIASIAQGQTRCGVTTDVTTTAASVPFGVVGLQAFTNAAQRLTVSTNAANGYAVTARANDQLGLNGQACPGDPTPATNPECIQDTTGNGGNITSTSSGAWDDTDFKGFGYSLQEDTVGVAVFNYDDTTGNCSGGTYCARRFADAEQSQSPVSVMTNNTVAEADIADVCYRIVPSAINAAGNYENNITYTATATF